jgi:hypothetical protein
MEFGERWAAPPHEEKNTPWFWNSRPFPPGSAWPEIDFGHPLLAEEGGNTVLRIDLCGIIR